MNKIFDVITITLLIVMANSSVMAAPQSATPSPSPNLGRTTPTGSLIVAKYECRSRGPSSGEIVLRANKKYEVKQQTGKYQPSQLGYRFLTGPLQGQSIVIAKDNIYLVNTKNEARAAELAAADAALFCTGGMIHY
jgi:hypothetical protein